MTRKEEREKIMSDEDRVKSAQRRGKRCPYCLGKNLIETVTDRLFMCCNTCAQHDENTPVIKTELPCVVCGTSIKSSGGPDEITLHNVDSMSFDIGAAAKISYGYGCELDGDVYIIAICRRCTKSKTTEGKLTYIYNYIR